MSRPTSPCLARRKGRSLVPIGAGTRYSSSRLCSVSLVIRRCQGLRTRDDLETKLDAMQIKLRDLEMRLKLTESELRGQIDLSQFGKPEILADESE